MDSMGKTKKTPKIEVTYAHGWIHGQEATDDDSTGERILVGGLKTRVRADDIALYQAVEPGVLAFFLRNRADIFYMVGSIEATDAIMARHELKEIK